MTSHNKALLLIASKLGLEEEDRLISKAAEFERLLQTKSITGCNINDSSKLVICLSLAASLLTVDFDEKTAIKYSGLKPAMYVNYKKMLSRLLEIENEILSVAALCVTLQCTSVQAQAEDILEEYKKSSTAGVDLHYPHYVCLAVYHACRLNKVKVSKTKLIEKSRLKAAQWAKLDAEWTKFVNDKFAGTVKRRRRPTAAKKDTKKEMAMDISTSEEEQAEPEPYEVWKRRILKAAYEKLAMEEMETNKPSTADDTSPSTKRPRKDASEDTPEKLPLIKCYIKPMLP